MKRILGTTILMLVCGTMLFASKFDGKWKASVETDMGPFEFTVVYKVDRETISGTMMTEFGDFEMNDGTVSGDTFEMSIEIEWNVIKLTGELVNDDEILLKSNDPNSGETEMTMTRIKE